MKTKLVLLLLFFYAISSAQLKDKRAVLNLGGGIDVTISPDNKLWMVSNINQLSYTSNIDSNWKSNFIPLNDNPELKISGALERVSFFNKDTAILTGNLAIGKGYFSRKGICLITQDGGISWKKVNFGGKSWIYTVDLDNDGNAWMGTGFKELNITNDHGFTWETIKLPYRHSERTYAIHLFSANYGIIGSENNEILLSRDRWKTTEYIPTPFDQKLIKNVPEEEYEDTRISNIKIWKDYFIVEQFNCVFYTKQSNIQWKKFPKDLICFAINDQNNSIVALSKENKAIEFFTPINYNYIARNELQLHYYIDNIVVQNGAVYAYIGANVIAKLENNKWEYKTMYTTDYKITPPKILAEGKALYWGVSSDHLYLKEENNEWYRIDILPFEVEHINLINDSTAILWDGSKTNYKYNLKSKTPISHIYNKPLNQFINFPISELNIKSYTFAFNYDQESVNYKLKDQATLVCHKYFSTYEEKQKKRFSHFITQNELSTILNNINNNIERIPTINDFKITDLDIKAYQEMIESNFIDPYNEDSENIKDFYRNIVFGLDTIGVSTIEYILDKYEDLWSSSSVRFEIKISNTKNDNITFSQEYYHSFTPWNLPWKVEYNGKIFNCYDIEFSQFINSCLPEEFDNSDAFDNKYLILKIAEHLSNKAGIE